MRSIWKLPERPMAPRPLADLRMLGLDPGWASLGWAVVDLVGSRYVLRAGGVVETKAQEEDEKRATKGAINARRTAEQALALCSVWWQWRPGGIVVEEFTPNKGQQGTQVTVQSLKTERVVGLGHMLGHAFGAHVISKPPSALRKPLTGEASMSKEEIVGWCKANIDGAPAFFAQKRFRAKKRQEHVADAMGHAVLGIREVLALRKKAQL